MHSLPLKGKGNVLWMSNLSDVKSLRMVWVLKEVNFWWAVSHPLGELTTSAEGVLLKR